mgnify:CR=1 FL=1
MLVPSTDGVQLSVHDLGLSAIGEADHFIIVIIENHPEGISPGVEIPTLHAFFNG